MRESIGSVSLLNFIIFFILLIFAFLIGTFSYYKAYKVNNVMISIIEKYEGFNELSYKEIEEQLDNYAYERIDYNCERGISPRFHLISYKNKNEVKNDGRGYEGYCVYVKTWDSNDSVNNSKDRYDSYQVSTVITFNFPIIQKMLKLRVSSRSNRIYNFECAQDASCVCADKSTDCLN